ncbi:solute carrier family 46 member 3 [Denticeps clupeoides]|uniref:Solute carrier family 46 member 3 n=1 Tax=Denticeps clupeoides TaxID=299321 RepID=A0AAY4ABL8_9TELE|nr:solute carrier family 46 member 3-like [Denticeps clupeoides]
MGRLYLIEPVVGVYAFAMFMTFPLLQQYVYRRQWERLLGSPYPTQANHSVCSSNLSAQHEAVQKETSLFLLYSELCYLFPSLIMSLLLVSYSDHQGRKVAIIPPLVGDLIFSFCYFTVSHLSLNLNYLLGASFLTGLLGGPSSLIGGCFAYVADRCNGEGKAREKTIRMAVLDMLLGVLSGLASLCTGFFIETAGFTWPFLTTGFFHMINLAYVFFVLEESMVRPELTDLASRQPSEVGPAAVASRLQGVYLLFAASTRRRNVALGLSLAAFTFYKVAKLGGMSLFILYELNAPLCWSEVLVGYGSALSTAIYLASFAGVSLLSRCVHDAYLVLLGLLSVAAGLLMAAFARTTLLMLLVRLPLLLSIMPTPVMRSMMSKMVLPSEQGALFACIAFMEMLSVGVAFIIFSSIYAATVAWFSGFSFLLASGLTLIPAVLICVVLSLRLDTCEEDVLLEQAPMESTGTLQLPQWDMS